RTAFYLSCARDQHRAKRSARRNQNNSRYGYMAAKAPAQEVRLEQISIDSANEDKGERQSPNNGSAGQEPPRPPRQQQGRNQCRGIPEVACSLPEYKYAQAAHESQNFQETSGDINEGRES